VPLRYNLLVRNKEITSLLGADRETNRFPEWEKFVTWLGDPVAKIVAQQNVLLPEEIEEIRLRIGQPLLLVSSRAEVFLGAEGSARGPAEAYRIRAEDLAASLERITQSSLYAAEEKLRQGFVTLPGGHRVGVVGQAVVNQGRIQTLKHVTALNFRLAHDIRGRGKNVLPYLLLSDGTFAHTLLLSPPRSGKTTLLRELIRLLSNGLPDLPLPGCTVGVVDERGELAAMWLGQPAFDLGLRTDILDGCPKAEGINMLIRSMGPQVIATDELGQPADVTAVREALRAGVKVLSTAHAAGAEDARERPILRQLLGEGIFQRLVVLSRRRGPGTIEGIIDPRNGQVLYREEGRAWSSAASS